MYHDARWLAQWNTPDFLEFFACLHFLLLDIVIVSQCLGLVTDRPVPLVTETLTQRPDPLPLLYDLVPFTQSPVSILFRLFGLRLGIYNSRIHTNLDIQIFLKVIKTLPVFRICLWKFVTAWCVWCYVQTQNYREAEKLKFQNHALIHFVWS